MISGTSRGIFVAITFRWICSRRTTMIGHSVSVLKLRTLLASVLGALSPPSSSSVTEPGLGENAGYQSALTGLGLTVAAGVEPDMVEFVSKVSLTIAGMLAYISKTKSRNGCT